MNTIYLPGPDSFMSTTNLTHGILYITSYEAFTAEQFTVARLKGHKKYFLEKSCLHGN